MCGICGIIKNNAGETEKETVREMNARLVHRGPDSEGYYNSRDALFAMRRLSIMDLSGGHQPLWNEDGSIGVVANGEIYNFQELKKGLEAKGHKFKTGSDCESIVHAYEEWGEECVKKLRGMFAFALHDQKRKKVIIARDRMGEKPLYYHEDGDRFIFSSEMKSLIGAVKNPILDPRSLDLFLTLQYVPEPRTFFKNIQKLEAAHMFVFNTETGDKRLKKYWSPLDAPRIDGNPEKAIRNVLEETMKMTIASDVPLGISLSGGIDSSIIAVLAEKYSPKKLSAFTAGYAGKPDNDERDKARKLAKKLDIPFYEVEISKKEFVVDFPKMAYSMDDPIGDIAAYGYYRVMQEARKRKVPVLLNGLGADEIFWGYEWMRNAASRASKLRGNFFGETFLSMLGEHHVFSRYPQFKRDTTVYKNIYTEKFRNESAKKILPDFPKEAGREELAARIIEEIFHLWLYPNCTALNDRLSMASAVELRSPFLDYRLVETAIGIAKAHPNDFSLSHKLRLREAVKDIVPREILDRKKRGFTPPTKEWMFAIMEVYADIAVNGYVVKTGLLEKRELIKLIDQKLSEKRASEFLYRLILFEMWHKAMIKSPP